MRFKKVISYLELEEQGRGIIMEVTRPLLLEPFYLVKWPITPNKSTSSVALAIAKLWDIGQQSQNSMSLLPPILRYSIMKNMI